MEIKSPIQNEIPFQIGTSKERIHKKLNLKFSSISNSLNCLFKFSLPIQKSFLIHKTNFEFKPEISYSTLDLEFNLLDFLQIKFQMHLKHLELLIISFFYIIFYCNIWNKWLIKKCHMIFFLG